MSSGGPSYEQLAELVVEQAATIRRLDVRVSELEGVVAELVAVVHEPALPLELREFRVAA